MFTHLFRIPDPYRDLSQLHREVDALLNEWGSPRRRHAGPAFDVHDDGDVYRVVAEAPGLRPEDLEVEVTADTLTVRGRREPRAPEGYTVHRRERGRLELARSFSFPAKLDPERVSASLERGVLTIKLAKRADARPRSITVRSAA